MNILFAIKTLDDVKGGAERVLADVTAGLVDRDHDISVLTFDQPGGQSFYPLHDKVRRLSLGIGNTKKQATLGETLSRIKAMRRTVLDEKPDVVVAFMHSSFVLMAFALLGTGIPVIASEHIVPAHYKTRRMEFVLLCLAGLFVKKITVLSETIKKDYPRFLQGKMVPLANPVLIPEKKAAPKGEEGQRKAILTVGRLDPQKDQKTLIQAFARLADEYPDWDVTIIGEGALRAELETLIKDMNLDGRVFMPGSTPDISAVYQKAHIFALPSLYESFGLATAEAMAHGLPVIGFADCPGTNELITDGENGILIAARDRVEAMARALDGLMGDPSLRVSYGEKGQETSRQFDAESIVGQWEALLQS